MKLYEMIGIYLKYDNMHTFGVINALICIKNHVISCINSMLSTNPVGMPVLGRMMLDLLLSRSLLALFSTTRLSIKQCSSSGLDLLSLSFWQPDAKREPKNVRREKMKAFICGFLGFECKEG